MFHVKHHHQKENRMPKVEIEILRTVTITREESVTLELDVPKQVLDDEEVLDWVDQIMEEGEESSSAKEKAIRKTLTDAQWDVSDEDEDIEYTEANPTA